MGIQNFPAALQPIIQQGYLERQFEEALRSKLGYRGIADREKFSVGIGETLTKTRAGLKPAVTTPLAANTNTNLDNGLSSSTFAVEQYTITLNMYADTIDLNMVTNRVGIKNQFMQNAKVNGEQAARSLDDLARNALFGAYAGGNTRVRTTLGSAGPTIAVDDVRGFQYIFGTTTPTTTASSSGVSPTMLPVSSSNTLACTVNGDAYTLTGVAVDVTNVSTTPNGISGTLTFSTNVTTTDGTAGNTVLAATASLIVRPSGRGNTSLIQATDTLTMSNVLDGISTMQANGVPGVDGSDMYDCFLDPKSARQLFADPDFKQLFQGTGMTITDANNAFRSGVIDFPFLGVRFKRTTEAFVQAHPSISGLNIRRPIICGQGALIEGDFAGMAAADVAPKDSIISMVDDIAMVTREPLDRLQQIIAQSWYWIGGFCAPSDSTTKPSTLPTASNATYKRAVMIEHAG